MHTLAQLILKYREYGLARTNKNGELILSIDHAKNFVEECYKNDLCVIGIEGFEIGEDFIKPRMDMIADFSSVMGSPWNSRKKTCFVSAQNFLKHFEAEQDIGYEFVVVENKKIKDEQ